MLKRTAVVFSSPCSGANVEKHFDNLQLWLTKKIIQMEDTDKSKIKSEDLKVNDKPDCIRTIILTV